MKLEVTWLSSQRPRKGPREEEATSYQLVGGVKAHQGDDG